MVNKTEEETSLNKKSEEETSIKDKQITESPTKPIPQNKGLSYLKYLVIILLISFFIIFIFTFINKNKVYDYSNDNITFQYDNSWKLQDNQDINLIHKKTKSTINIQIKEVELKYTDSSLNDIIEDIKTGIEKQNPDYHLINEEKNTSYNDTIYTYLYENNQEQVLVNIRKKNNKIAIVYYQAQSQYFDIILDSVDYIIDSIELKVGQRIN